MITFVLRICAISFVGGVQVGGNTQSIVLLESVLTRMLEDAIYCIYTFLLSTILSTSI